MFKEIEDYREDLEIKHLRTKNHFVLGLLLGMMIITITYMFVTAFDLEDTITLMIGFLLVILLNIAQLAYGKENYKFLQLNKYITTIYVYVLAIVIIFLFESPVTITVLFLAYAISAFYQDIKVMTISNVLLLFSALMILINFPEFLAFPSGSTESSFGIVFFFIFFIAILTVSSYIIIKQKRFFYNQIALSKETEFRNIDLLIDIQKQATHTDFNTSKFYERSQAFLDEFSQKIEAPNAFKDKLDLMAALENNTPKEKLLKKYPLFKDEDLDRLEYLLIGGKHKLRKIAIKMSHTFNIDIKKREIFSETHFKSFNHQYDNLDIKLLAFVVFYAALKRGLDGISLPSDQAIHNILTSTDYYYYIDPKVMRIYEKNSEVFETIAKDILRKEEGK